MSNGCALDSAAKGALFGFAGTGAGYATNAVQSAIAKAAFSNLSVDQQLFATSNAITGPYLSSSAAQWAIGGTVMGNLTSNVVSNMNQ